MADALSETTTGSSVLAEIQSGEGLSLSAAGRLFPGHRGGASVDPSTTFRWVTKGARAVGGQFVRLEAVRVGGRWLTSRGAVARFVAALTEAANPTGSAPTVRAPAARVTIEDLARGFRRAERADVTTILGPDGEVLPPSQWPEDVRRAITRVEVEELSEMQPDPDNPKRKKKVAVGTKWKVWLENKTECRKVLAQWKRMIGPDANAENPENAGPVILGGVDPTSSERGTTGTSSGARNGRRTAAERAGMWVWCPGTPNGSRARHNGRPAHDRSEPASDFGNHSRTERTLGP